MTNSTYVIAIQYLGLIISMSLTITFNDG